MDIPAGVSNSNLYRRLADDPELLSAVLSLRKVAGTLAANVSRTVPGFTDHSIRHMDALWGVCDRILTASEIAVISHGEDFLLACGFYLHDIGMAYATTEEGLARIRSCSLYKSLLDKAPPALKADSSIEARTVAETVRQIHATAATELATHPIPGTDIYLFDSRDIRETWAETCGRIATSHHWNLEKVERELGSQGVVPLPLGRKGDLGFVASILRIIDYAHINRDRASSLDRAFRQQMEPESLIHWLAQEHIDGPERDGADLVFRAAKPVSDVNAWWLYFEMLKGLDIEIRSVRRYLDRRATSQGRLSLQGVRGVTAPEEAVVFIPTSGFLPIEVNLRTGSIEKLVQLLAGETLYGPDPMAAVRELIQNSCDAVMLKGAVASGDYEKAALTIPIRIALRTTTSNPRLEITDPGVGMTAKIMTDYLISIASDYWTSQFHLDFPGAQGRGFRPAGKFGIGFLSVFMLGEEVIVESNRDGGERYKLHLHGVGRRGEIRVSPSPSGSGTAVRVELRKTVVESLKPLNELVRVYAPMCPHTLEVDVDGQRTEIAKGWLHKLDAAEFHNWILQAIKTLSQNRSIRDQSFGLDTLWWNHRHSRRGWRRKAGVDSSWPDGWPAFQESRARLLASFEGYSLLTLKGLTIQPIVTPGFVGIIDLEFATPDVSRRRAIDADVSDVLVRANLAVRPQIVEKLNCLAQEGLLINRLEFIAECVRFYGRQTILDASLPWISFLKLPGEIELVSCATLLERLTKSKVFFVAYGTGPWNAMKRWVECISKPTKETLAIVIDDHPADHLSYNSGETKVGKLSDLWPDCVETSLFGTVLRLAAEAWQVNIEELCSQEGWNHTGSSVWGLLSRP